MIPVAGHMESPSHQLLDEQVLSPQQSALEEHLFEPMTLWASSILHFTWKAVSLCFGHMESPEHQLYPEQYLSPQQSASEEHLFGPMALWDSSIWHFLWKAAIFASALALASAAASLALLGGQLPFPTHQLYSEQFPSIWHFLWK